MRQLMFDLDTNNIVNAVPKHTFDYNELPYEVRYNIENISKKRLIPTTDNKHYCSICLNKLNENNYCYTCKRQLYKDENIKNKELDFLYDQDNSYNFFYGSNKFYYYYFDVVDNEVLLYLIEEVCKYHNNITYKPFKITDFNIIKIYHINDTYYNELVNEGIVYYKDINIDSEYSSKYDGLLLDFNLDYLSKTLYKYCNIFSIYNRLNYNIEIDFYKLVILPLKYPLFENLYKLKLYNLAFECFKINPTNSSFYGVFGLDKSYLEFMQEFDIDINQLNSLRHCKIKNIDIINFVCDCLEVGLDKYKLDYYKLYDLFKINNYDGFYLDEYVDYLDMASNLGYDLNDKKVLYPEDLLLEHNNLMTKINTVSDPEINNRINNISNNLKFNLYEDDKYIIFPADSVEEMVNEATNQQNCLVMYCDPYSRGDSEIYFLREKNNINESLVTIEVKNRKVIQARCKYNELPSKELSDIIKQFEKNLVIEYKEEE